MNNVDRKRKGEKKDNDRGESNRERKSVQKKKNPPNPSRPTKKNTTPKELGLPPPPFFPSPKGHVTLN
jgi:hypothetical protein